MFGYWLVKTWMTCFDVKKVESIGTAHYYKMFYRYKVKRYWLNLSLHHLGSMDKEFMDNYMPRVKRVHHYTKGGYFGELAIIKGGIRKAGIYCTEDTEFAVLSKKYENDFLFLYKA